MGFQPNPPLPDPPTVRFSLRPDAPSQSGAGVLPAGGGIFRALSECIESTYKHLRKTMPDGKDKICSPKQILRWPEPRNSSELHGECRRAFPSGMVFLKCLLVNGPHTESARKIPPPAGRTPAPDWRPLLVPSLPKS